jgi:hypothetical protein
MGIPESIALAGLVVTVGATAASGVRALWAISKGLGNFEGKILEMLAHHQNTLQDHEERLRAGKL